MDPSPSTFTHRSEHRDGARAFKLNLALAA
jgi:hypothetical protein